jgi:hypothetical protein
VDRTVKSAALAAWVALLAPGLATCAELTPFVHDGRLGVRLTDTKVPPTLRKDLLSGLTNRVLVQVVLRSDTLQPVRKVLDIAIQYDLWEETFNMRITVDETIVSSRTVRQVDEVLADLRDLRLPGLFVAPTPSPALSLTAEMLFNPIDKERMDEIRKWVAENSRPAPTARAGFGTGLPTPAPASDSRALFNKIFAEYAAGASVAAAWKDSATSRPFKLEELRDEPER